MVRPSQPLLLGVREVSRSIDISGMRHRHFAVGAQIDQRRQAQAVPNRIRPLHKALLHVVGLGVHQRHREENGEGEKESAAHHGFTHFNSTSRSVRICIENKNQTQPIRLTPTLHASSKKARETDAAPCPFGV